MRTFIFAFALLVLWSCKPAPQTVVDAKDYDSFWLWAGVEPQPVLDSARSVYILDGQIEEADGVVRMLEQRPAIPRTKGREIWMVMRVHTLRWTPEITQQVLARLKKWRGAGNEVVGLQIDFDARTRHLNEYASFLKNVHQRLPPDYKLSITGLLDWSSNGDPAALASVAGSVDEVVLQVYQGRHTIPGYQGYLAQLHRLKQPFKIGLVQGGEWEAADGLEASPYFKGYVVFLLNDSGSSNPRRAPTS